MTKDEAAKRIMEWKMIEATNVWADLVDGLIRLHTVHDLVVHKSSDLAKISKSQGACDICKVILNARDNQIKEANEVIEGKKRAIAQPTRYS